MATVGYNHQTLCRAIDLLMLTPGDARFRLLEAAAELRTLEPDVFPKKTRRLIRALQKKLDRYFPKSPIGGTGPMRRSFQERTALKLIKDAWTIYGMADSSD